jgi:Flp pilus assembly protein TadD
MIKLGIFTMVAFAGLSAQAPKGPQPEFAREGQRLMREGKLPEALALYRAELQKSPESVAAHNGAGVALDLMGQTKEARVHFGKAIEAAPTPQAKAAARRAMAMSYAFDGDCANTVKFEQLVMEHWAAEKNFYQQGEMANEAARVCIDAGDLDTAYQSYKTGTELGLQEPGIAPDRAALWKFRWEHAQARIAARRGKKDEAQKHVLAAKELLDGNPGMAKAQAVFFPYLTGYVALYAGDAATALSDLGKANQTDPFIRCLTGMALEKLGRREEAMEQYRAARNSTAHNPPAAFAVPFARKKLGAK